MSLELLDQKIRRCRRCSDLLINWSVDPKKDFGSVCPRPVLSKPFDAKIIVVGQAPGITEYRTGQPFSGDAGGTLRKLFHSCGLPMMLFDTTVYLTSVAKCFPGRKLNSTSGRSEDRVPCKTMTSNCSGFLVEQISMIRPKLVVTIGSFASNELIRLAGYEKSTLEAVVGTIRYWNELPILFLPHTSGESRFLNKFLNSDLFEQAKNQLSKKIAGLMS